MVVEETPNPLVFRKVVRRGAKSLKNLGVKLSGPGLPAGALEMAFATSSLDRGVSLSPTVPLLKVGSAVSAM